MSPRIALAILALGALALGATACGEPPNLGLAFRVEAAAPDVWAADDVCVALEAADGAQLALECEPLGSPPRVPSLSSLPFGPGLQVRVETVRRQGDAVGAGTVVARGRSFPFDVSPDGVNGSPDVTMGVLGSFAPLDDPPWALPPVAVAPAPGGALVATSNGDVWRFDAHPDDDGAPRWARAATAPERAGARYGHFDDGSLLAVGGAEAGASLFGPNGRLLAELDDPVLEDHRWGATVVVGPGARDAFVFGGSDEPAGEPFVAATRIRRLDAGGLRASIDVPLRLPRRDASAAVLRDVGDQAQPDPVALLLGGSAPDEAIVVDPLTNVPPPRRFELPPPAVPPEAAVGVLARDLGLVVGGGPDPMDPEAGRRVRVLAVDRADGRPREVVRLLAFDEARRRPAVADFGDGLALLVGGLDADEVPTGDARVVFAGRFEIVVERTGDAPAPLGAPRAATLGDGSVLVVDPEGITRWFPSRQRGL